MRKYDGYEKAEAFTGEYETIEPGGYICKILQVKAEDKDYGTLLRIAFDIAEGERKGYYKRLYERRNESNPDAKWPGMYYQTVKEDDLKYFKGFITAIESSNPGFKWNWNEKELEGKLFGGVFGQEEYLNNKKEVKVSTKCVWVRSIEQIRNGIEPPEIKRLKNKPSTVVDDNFYNMDDDDLPF